MSNLLIWLLELALLFLLFSKINVYCFPLVATIDLRPNVAKNRDHWDSGTKYCDLAMKENSFTGFFHGTVKSTKPILCKGWVLQNLAANKLNGSFHLHCY